MELISVLQYHINIKEELGLLLSHKALEYCDRSTKYIKLMKHPLNIGMFIECDSKGRISTDKGFVKSKDYKTLFSGFELQVVEEDKSKPFKIPSYEILINKSLNITLNIFRSEYSTRFLLNGTSEVSNIEGLVDIGLVMKNTSKYV